MHITDELLTSKNACANGKHWFNKGFPAGIDIQIAIDRAVEEDYPDYADWLITAFGPINRTLKVDGDLIVEKSLYFCGSIAVTGRIQVQGQLRAGSGIKAGSGIEAGLGIEAGSGIEAGWGIEAGSDFGIYVGLRLRMSLRAKRATVTAKEEPKNIVCGTYKQPDNVDVT